MEFGYFPTPPQLTTAVKAVWFARGTRAEFAVAEPIVPDGCVEVVLNLGDRFMQVDDSNSLQPRDLLVGQMTRPTVASPTGEVDLIGIRFRSGRAGAMLRTPMWELRDRLVSASSVLPVFDRLAGELPSLPHERRAAHLAEVLRPYCARVVPDRLVNVEAALSRIAAANGTESIDVVASAIGVTRRHLERQFLEHVGLGVKQAARIMRIQRVLGVLKTRTPLSGAEIAARFGYSDQAHLIHECRALTGTTPGRLTTSERSLARLMRRPQPIA